MPMPNIHFLPHASMSPMRAMPSALKGSTQVMDPIIAKLMELMPSHDFIDSPRDFWS